MDCDEKSSPLCCGTGQKYKTEPLAGHVTNMEVTYRTGTSMVYGRHTSKKIAIVIMSGSLSVVYLRAEYIAKIDHASRNHVA